MNVFVYMDYGCNSVIWQKCSILIFFTCYIYKHLSVWGVYLVSSMQWASVHMKTAPWFTPALVTSWTLQCACGHFCNILWHGRAELTSSEAVSIFKRNRWVGFKCKEWKNLWKFRFLKFGLLSVASRISSFYSRTWLLYSELKVKCVIIGLSKQWLTAKKTAELTE